MTADQDKAGHRQRLRERFLAGEASSRTEESLLELLLAYGIARKDVRPLAEHLLTQFGGLERVLAVSSDELRDIQGVGDAAAALLKLVDCIRLRQGSRRRMPAAKETASQATLFRAPPEQKDEKAPSERKPSPRKVISRRGTEMFTNAVLKEAIELLPGAPDTDSVEEIRAYLRDNLHYSAEQTRQRYASYITRRMFPEGYADAPMRAFARAFAESQALRDVCFYRFLRVEPLEVKVIEDLLLPNLGTGRLGRDRIRKYLAETFPDSKSIKGCGQALVEALDAAGVANVDRTKVTFSPREIPLSAFAFVLHSEFPEPGMYDMAKLEGNRAIRAMLWNPARILPAVYELRNQGLISKVSEIDSVRQFTTKWTLDQVVERMVAKEGRA